MSTLQRIGLLTIVLVCIPSVHAEDVYRHHMLVKVMPENAERRRALFAFEQLDLNAGDSPNTPFLFAYPEDLELLDSQGYSYAILQDDLEDYYASRLANNPLALMGGYRTYDEIVAELDSIHADHPEITTAKFSIGNSVQGRPQWVIKISDNPQLDENEPEVFYNSLIHPREIVASEVIFYFMHHLTDDYGIDPEITELVNSRELYFLPCVNPDGHVYNQQTNPNGGGLWRKNRRNNGNGTWGVDLARNYSVAWGIDNEGSSPNPGAIAYRGPAPFSEPESQNMRDFVNSRQFILSLDYHTYGNVFLYPWGTSYYDGDGLTAEDAVFDLISDSLANAIEQVFGTGVPYGTGWELYYNTNGNPFDWNYCDTVGHGRVFSISPEAGTWDDGFWPTIQRADSIKQEFLPANILFAQMAGMLSPPADVTMKYHEAANAIHLQWSPTGAAMYRIYSSGTPEGPFDALEIETSSTSAIVSFSQAERLFYVVHSAY